MGYTVLSAPASGGGGATTYRTYAALSTVLLAGSVGDTADLVDADGAKIATWRKVGASALRVEGVIRLDLCDGSEFTEGTSGSGSDIERASALTWSSGLVVDGQDVYFRCFGAFAGQGSIVTAALFTPTVLSNGSNQSIMIGTAANSDAAGSLGGFRYTFGSWKRADRGVTGAAGGEGEVSAVGVGTQSHAIHAQLAAGSNVGVVMTGGFTAGDTGTSQRWLTNNGRPEPEHDDHCVMIRVDDQGGTATVKFTEISVLAMAPAA